MPKNFFKNGFFSKEIQEEVEAQHKAWDLQSNAERIDSISNYQASIINGVVTKANELNDRSGVFWEKPTNKEDMDKTIPFNGSTGMPFTNLDNLLMRSVMSIEGYKEPIFLTMKQANLMGGRLKKTGELTRNGKEEFVKAVKIAQLTTKEFVPELDENGKKKLVPVLDKDGKPILNKKGEEVKKIAGEWKELKEPMYESISYYNIEQFDNLDKSKLKPLDLEPLNKKRESIAKNPQAKLDYKLGMLRGKTGDLTLNNLYEFVKATQTGKDFAPKERVRANMQATKEFVNEKSQQQGFSR